MASVTLRLHHRIVIPVVLVALVTTSLAAYISQLLIRRALEARVATQLGSATTAMATSGFALNESILGRVKDIAGADVVTYTLAGKVLASTFPDASRAELVATVLADRAIASASGGETLVRRTTCATVPCFVAYRRVPATADTVIALVEQTSELSAATQAMTRTIVLSAGLGLLVLVLVGQVVARRVTQPLDRLVTFTHDVSSGSASRRAPVGNDEIGTLASAFNDMLDRLEKAQGALVQSEKLALAGLMSARVAHDIRNPLSSLRMQAQLLRSRVSNSEGQTMLQSMLHDVDRVESVVRGLLELAKPGENRLTPVDFNDVIRRVLDHLTLQFTHRKIVLSMDLSSGLPAIPLDAERFEQAFLNVISNATEAMQNGGTLHVSTGLEDGTGAILLSVCDDGIGVAPDMLDKVFDPFVSSKREGVGLGLVNTKAVVESHGGRVQLAPRVPRGTCVTISLPVPKAAAMKMV
jgi:signal transduction histidine kinase